MFRKLLMVPVLALAALVLQTAAAAEALPPADQWVPQDAVIVLELSHPKALLDLALNSKVAETVTSLPAYQKLAMQPDFQQFLKLIEYLETRCGIDWRTGVRRLVGGGVTWAAGPGGTSLLIVDAEDEQILQQLHEALLGIAKADAAKRSRPDRVASKQYRGVTGWTFGGRETHAIVGKRLLMANRAEALRAVLDLRAQSGARNLASSPAYQAAKEAAGADAAATAFVSLAVLKQHPPVQQALAQTSTPAGSLLLAGVTEALRQADWLALKLRAEGSTLTLEAMLEGKPSDPIRPVSFASPGRPDEGAMANLSVPRRIAGFSFYRDLHGFYTAKDELFPERTSGLIFFENMMGIFFSGRDLTEQVLGEARPEIRLVVAEQEYDPAVGTPQVQFPAVAAVFRLRHPEQFQEVAEEAWQKALGLLNFTRGQQALPGMIIDRATHGDTRFSFAYFSTSGEKDKAHLDSRFNFRPALAKLGDYLVVSSTDGLARDLIDALKKEMARPLKALPETHSLVEIDGTQLASILGANRKNLVRQNMIDQGKTAEQAETGVDLVVALLKHLGQARLNLGSHDGRTKASLELKLNLP